MKKMDPTGLAVVGLVAVLLAACSTTGGYQYRPPAGSTVELTQVLKFFPGSLRLYIQYGEVTRWQHLNTWVPYCSFGLTRTRDGRPLTREIHPTRFATGDVRIGVHAAAVPACREEPPVIDALAGPGIEVAGLSGAPDGGTPWPYRYYTEIELYSAEEPQVDDLTCAFDGGPMDRNLTVEEIGRVLSGIADIY